MLATTTSLYLPWPPWVVQQIGSFLLVVVPPKVAKAATLSSDSHVTFAWLPHVTFDDSFANKLCQCKKYIIAHKCKGRMTHRQLRIDRLLIGIACLPVLVEWLCCQPISCGPTIWFKRSILWYCWLQNFKSNLCSSEII